MAIDDLADLVTTRSYYLDASPHDQQQIVAEVDAFLSRQFRGAESVHLPYRTYCFRAQLIA